MKRVSLVVLFLTFVGCESPSGSDSIQKISSELGKALEETKETLKSATSSQGQIHKRTAEEVSKLFSIEYKVEEIAASLPAHALEERLAALGKERWDCFNIESRPSGLRVYCKRLPTSYLKYLPGLVF